VDGLEECRRRLQPRPRSQQPAGPGRAQRRELDDLGARVLEDTDRSLTVPHLVRSRRRQQAHAAGLEAPSGEGQPFQRSIVRPVHVIHDHDEPGALREAHEQPVEAEQRGVARLGPERLGPRERQRRGRLVADPGQQPGPRPLRQPAQPPVEEAAGEPVGERSLTLRATAGEERNAERPGGHERAGKEARLPDACRADDDQGAAVAAASVAHQPLDSGDLRTTLHQHIGHGD
jgi:hypothetical protein